MHTRVKRMVTKAFTILTSEAVAASTDDICQTFCTFIANKLRNYLPHMGHKVQHKISHNIFAANQELIDVSYPFSTLSPASQVSSPTTSSSAAGSEDIILSDLMCP